MSSIEKELPVSDTIILEFAKSLERLDIDEWEEVSSLLLSVAGVDLSDSQIERLSSLASTLSLAIDRITENEEEVSAIGNLVACATDFIRELSRTDTIDVDSAEVASHIIGFFLDRYLWSQRPGIASLLALVGVLEGPIPVETEFEDDADFDIGDDENDTAEDPLFLLAGSRFRLDRLSKLLRQPEEWASEVYGWGGDFNFEALSERVYALMRFAGLDAGQYACPPWAVVDDEQELRVCLFRYGDVTTSFAEMALAFGKAPRGISNQEGIVLTLTLLGRLEETLVNRPGLTVTFQTDLDLSDGASVLLEPSFSPSFFLGSGYESGGLDMGQLNLTVEATESQPHYWYKLGGMYLYSQNEKLFLGLRGDLLDPELVMELDIGRLEFGIDISDADSFFSRVLSNDLAFGLNFTLGYSSQRGFYLGGGGGLQTVIPLHVEIGSVILQELSVGLDVGRDDGMDFTARISGSFKLGPISGTVCQVGVRAGLLFDFGQDDAVQGLSFVPPTGVGLVLDSASLTGGGFLDFDEDNKRYAGIVQLKAGGLNLVGIGLITTQMPDGSDGFSLLINIGVEFSPPIQLPYGFTLSGVGGLIGLNRTMDIEVLRAGLRAQTLDSILFPEDPVSNAARIVSNLRSVFPPENERLVVGPMIKLGWGSPTIIWADIGIFIELPEPVRIALLGQITANLPQEHNAIIELHIDVLGVIDFEGETLSIDATIYDSRIYEYALTGDAAVRFSWGDSPSLALSLGGFHPRFTPPAGFPALRRLTLNLSQGRDLQLYCSAYQAITSNTVQFGATVELFARKSGATLEGRLSFDTLIQMSPFAFMVDITGNVVARYRGHRLVSVALSMQLSGPTPWNARGRASFGILMWDVSVRFNKTWGPRTLLKIDPVNAWDLLKPALERDESWGARLPSGVSAVETFSSQEDDGNTVLVHPMGSLEVRQNVLPLEIELQKIGGAPLEEKQQSYFSINGATISETELEIADIEDDFARAQFLTLSDSDRLSLPSFEKMNSGVSLGGGGICFGSNISNRSLEYETILLREDQTSCATRLTESLTVDVENLKRQLQSSAAGRSEFRRTGRYKYAMAGKQKLVKQLRERYQLVDTDTMEPVKELSMGRVQAEQAMSAYLKISPELVERLKVVPAAGVTK